MKSRVAIWNYFARNWIPFEECPAIRFFNICESIEKHVFASLSRGVVPKLPRLSRSSWLIHICLTSVSHRHWSRTRTHAEPFCTTTKAYPSGKKRCFEKRVVLFKKPLSNKKTITSPLLIYFFLLLILGWCFQMHIQAVWRSESLIATQNEGEPPKRIVLLEHMPARKRELESYLRHIRNHNSCFPAAMGSKKQNFS